jgi:hypothetical protein
MILGTDSASVDGNKKMSWTAAKASGLSFAILRSNYGDQEDTAFARELQERAAASVAAILGHGGSEQVQSAPCRQGRARRLGSEASPRGSGVAADTETTARQRERECRRRDSNPRARWGAGF